MSFPDLCRIITLGNRSLGPAFKNRLWRSGPVTRIRSPIGVLLGSWLLLVSSGCAIQLPVTGLRPEYPRAQDPPREVDSLQPEFRWESFPRPRDYEQDKTGVLQRIDRVTYELRVWKKTSDLEGKLTYARQGIRKPSHKLEKPLEPSTEYLWTVRARFEIDGYPRVTQWGARGSGPTSTLWSDWDIHVHGYPFETPGQ